MPGSRPAVRLVLGSIAIAAVLFVGVASALTTVARWAEQRFQTYPYLAGEEPIRLMLPTVTAAHDGGTLLLGPSTHGDGVLSEVLAQRWGSRVRHGGLSDGTIDDYNLVLDYVVRAYGASALPQRIVVGMHPRVLANFPRNFGADRQPKAHLFTIAPINRYSPYFRVVDGALGTQLAPKLAIDASKAWLRFYLTKQQPRYRSGILALVEYSVDPDPLKVGFQERIPLYPDDPRYPLSRKNLATSMAFVRETGVATALRRWQRAYRSSYHNVLMTPTDDADLQRHLRIAEWPEWTPSLDEDMVAFQLSRLHRFVERYGIELIVLQLPLHPVLQERQGAERFAAYREAVARGLPNARIIDVSRMVSADGFLDRDHLTYDVAKRITFMLADSIGPLGRTIAQHQTP